MRARRRDPVRALPERSRRILEGVSTAPGPQAKRRIVDQTGRRLLLRFAHVPRLREGALVIGVSDGVARRCAAPGDARPHEVQTRWHRSPGRRAELLRVLLQVHGEALFRLDRDAASSVSPKRCRFYSPSILEDDFPEVRRCKGVRHGDTQFECAHRSVAGPPPERRAQCGLEA